MDPDLKPLFDKLTRLQKGVCLGVLEGKLQHEAYYAAGGLAKTEEAAKAIASRMLTDVNCRSFLEAAEGKAVSSAVMTKQQALERLSVLASTSVSDLVDFAEIEYEATGSDGEPQTKSQTVWSLRDSVQQDPEKLSAISELSAGKDGFKFKLHSQTAAIKELSAMLGWNAPTKIAETDKDGNDKEFSTTEIARKIAFALTQGKRESTGGDS